MIIAVELTVSKIDVKGQMSQVTAKYTILVAKNAILSCL